MTIDSAHNLIKGKIAEAIFELMFREAGEFSVFRNGYEYTAEYLAQHRHKLKFREVLDTISGAPDFLLVKTDEQEASAYLVEVKYRSRLDEVELVKIAERIVRRWDHTYVFLLSKTGFYFSPAHAIINTHGKIERLSVSWIPGDVQEKYRALAEDYLGSHRHEN